MAVPFPDRNGTDIGTATRMNEGREGGFRSPPMMRTCSPRPTRSFESYSTRRSSAILVPQMTTQTSERSSRKIQRDLADRQVSYPCTRPEFSRAKPNVPAARPDNLKAVVAVTSTAQSQHQNPSRITQSI